MINFTIYLIIINWILILFLKLDNLKFYYIYIFFYFKKSKTQLNSSPKINKNMSFFQEWNYGFKIDNEGD